MTTNDSLFKYLNSKEAVKDLPNMQWVAYTDKYEEAGGTLK